METRGNYGTEVVRVINQCILDLFSPITFLTLLTYKYVLTPEAFQLLQLSIILTQTPDQFLILN